MQAIVTKYLGPTNVKGSRIKAWCERGSIVVSYDDSVSDPHETAVKALVAKFVKEDEKRYGANKNPWARPMIQGGLPKGVGAHTCWVTEEKGTEVV